MKNETGKKPKGDFAVITPVALDVHDDRVNLIVGVNASSTEMADRVRADLEGMGGQVVEPRPSRRSTTYGFSRWNTPWNPSGMDPNNLRTPNSD